MASEGWLIESERELELEAIDLGIQRYRQWREREPLGVPETSLAGMGVARVEGSLAAVRAKVESGEMTSGPGYITWAPVLAFLPADVLAATGLVTVIENVRKHNLPTMQHLILEIGNAVETVFSMLKAREMDADMFRILSKTMKNWDPRRARRFYTKVTGLHRAFDQADRVRLGGFLLAHVLTTGWFTVEAPVKGPRYITMDPEVVTELERHHEQLELLSPMLYPMVCRPIHWEREDDGGYIYHRASILKPVNSRDKAPILGDVPAVRDAINHIQDTEWAVNKRVAEVQRQVWESGGGWAGVPRRWPHDVEVEVPRKDDATDAELAESKRSRAILHRANALAVGPRLEMLCRLRAVARLDPYPAFYHVWQMDWRSRVYPRASVLSPQGSDLDRGLLCFARPVPQTGDGREWLAIHLANCWAQDGVDKAPYAARRAWVAQHENRILACATDPLGETWWAGAENPWMFLATCFEWARKDGLTQLPVAIDGTCNGLQHYSAVGLDPIGGAATNLVPSGAPRDIYADVAAATLVRLAGRVERKPLPEITRAVVKRAVMTVPYGLTPIGMRDQFIADGWVEAMPDPYESATLLRDLVQEAIGDIVVKAIEFMDWLKAAAAVANEREMPLQWVNPIGMTITQDYVVPKERRIRLPGLGQVLFLAVPEAERKLYHQKQINGTCPNVIHSFDAAHLMLTINACWALGLRHFWTVHDSFATYAPLVPVLGKVLREQFVKMYKENPLERFKEHNERRLGVTLPPLPRRGTLDIGVVADSPYAFG